MAQYPGLTSQLNTIAKAYIGPKVRLFASGTLFGLAVVYLEDRMPFQGKLSRVTFFVAAPLVMGGYMQWVQDVTGRALR